MVHSANSWYKVKYLFTFLLKFISVNWKRRDMISVSKNIKSIDVICSWDSKNYTFRQMLINSLAGYLSVNSQDLFFFSKYLKAFFSKSFYMCCIRGPFKFCFCSIGNFKSLVRNSNGCNFFVVPQLTSLWNVLHSFF